LAFVSIFKSSQTVIHPSKGITMKVNSNIKSLYRQAGYTLIELSISIAIIAVLIVSALYGVQKIIDDNKISTTIQTISSANNNIVKFKNMLSNRTFVQDTYTAAGLGVWPEQIVTRDSSNKPTRIDNPFGGNYFTSNNGAVVADVPVGGGYYIYMNAVPRNLCAPLAVALADSVYELSVSDDAGNTTVSAAALTTAGTSVKAANTNLDLAKLNSVCNTSNTKAKVFYMFFPF